MRFLATSLVTSLGLCLSLSITAPVLADPVQDALTRAVDLHATPAVARFDQAATALSDVAAADCTPEAVKPAYHSAFDAWMGLQHLHMGPLETNGRILTIAFWPDKKGLIPRALADMIAAKDPVVQDPQAFSQVSIAARGFFALEYMLYDDAFADYAAGSYSCALVQAITHDLGRMAQVIDTEWTAPDATHIRRSVAMTRTAISPRLAIRTFLNIGPPMNPGREAPGGNFVRRPRLMCARARG